MKTKHMLAVSLVINVLLGAFIWRHQSPPTHIAYVLPEESLPSVWPSSQIKLWVPIEIEFNANTEIEYISVPTPLRFSIPASPEVEFFPSNRDRGLYITPKDAGI